MEKSKKFYDINKLITDDVENANVDGGKSDMLYKKMYRTTFAKLTKLWNKQNQSTQVANKVKEMCGVYLKTPVVIR